METEGTPQGTVYAYRKKLKPSGEQDKFFVFEFEGADVSNEAWKNDVETSVFFETRGIGQGDVWFVWSNTSVKE